MPRSSYTKTHPDRDGQRYCPDCRQYRDMENFSARARRCKPHAIEFRNTRAQRAARSPHRMARLKRVYGITQDQYEEMFAAQGNVCAICGKPQPGSSKLFHVDHSHRTGRVRGILCARCNTGLGMFKDNPGALRAAADYLERAAKK